MNDLISVVIPVYNVENYLDRCIKSVIEQTYKNLEIIIVDDGSIDKSSLISDEWAKKDKRIKVFHKENGGLSSARNYGIEKSNGKYIAFLDSDDFINKNMYKKLLNYLKKTNSQIAIAGVKEFFDIKEITEVKEKLELEVLDDFDKYKYLNKIKVIETVLASNKLYDIKLFDKIRYPKGKIHEDAFIIHHLLNLSKRIVYTNEKLFYYFRRSDGITGIYNLKRLDEIDAIKDRVNFFNQNKFNNTIYQEESFIVYVGSLIRHYYFLNCYNKDTKEIKKLKKEFNNNYLKVMKCKVSFLNKIKYSLFRYIPIIYLLLKKIEVRLKYENRKFN